MQIPANSCYSPACYHGSWRAVNIYCTGIPVKTATGSLEYNLTKTAGCKICMGNYKKGLNTGRNNSGYYANRPKSDGIFGSGFGQSSSNEKAQKSFDKGYSKGRMERRTKQSCWKNFWE